MRSKLSLQTHFAYGIGDFGQNIIFQAAGFYLLYFYTDVYLVDAAFVGTLFLLARVWDGLNDPIMGYLAQRTQTRWGSYRPYLLFGAVPLALSMILLFTAPDLSGTSKLIYVAGVYIFFGMAFTAFNVPYGTLTAVMTEDYHERGKLTGFRMTFAMLGGIVGAVLFLPLVNLFEGTDAGYVKAATVFAGVILVTSLVVFGGIREKVQLSSLPTVPLRESFNSLLQNRPFWLLCLTFGCCFAALGVYSGTLVYFAQYVLGDQGLTFSLILVMMGTTGASVPFWAWISRRKGKRATFLVGAVFYLVAFSALFFIPAHQHTLIYVALVIQGIGNGAAAYTSWAMLPDTVEYGVWKTGKQVAGMSYGIFGFCFKLGLGLGGAFVGWGLAMVDYVPGESQSVEVLQMIRILLAVIPFILILIALISMWFYPITAQTHRQIRYEIAESGKDA